MPNRIIREGFLDSEAVNGLDWFAECIYHRLLLGADDAGRFDGRASVMAARLFPLKSNLRAQDVDGKLVELDDAGLLIRYQANDKPYIQITRFQRCGKSLMSKFPWKSGSFEIEYVKMPTRDGVKEFVKTSLPHAYGIDTPCAPHAHGVTTHSRESNTETETETETETVFIGAQVRSSRTPSKFDPRLNPPKCEDVRRVAEQYGVLMTEKDINDFLDHWTALEWENKSGIIRDWRPKVRKWHEVGKEIALQKNSSCQAGKKPFDAKDPSTWGKSNG